MLHNADLINNTFESNGLYTYAYQSNYFTDLYISQNGGGQGVCNAAVAVYTTTGADTTPIGTAPCYTSYAQGYGNPVFGINTFDWAVFAQDNWKFSRRSDAGAGYSLRLERCCLRRAAYVDRVS